MEKLQDLKLSGMSKTNGGKFDQVEISGLGKIFGDLEANRIHISGSGNIEGSIKVNKMDVEGNGFVDGSVESGELETSGNFRMSGQLKTETVKCSGRCRVDGSLKAGKVFSEGMISIGADVEAEEFYSKGAFTVNGLLNANKIDIKLGMESRAKEIGGEEIVVKKMRHHNFNFFLTLIGKSNKLQSDLIEGTNIFLEYTEAKMVRGQDVKIGAKCSIDTIEFSGTLEVDPSSVVKDQKKV